MSKIIYTPEQYRIVQNPQSRKWNVCHVTHERTDYYFFGESFPESLLPNNGQNMAILKSIPKSSIYTAHLDEPKKTSNGSVILNNVDNKLGIILYHSKLWRNAGVRVYRLFEGLTWDQKDTIYRGYLVKPRLGPEITLTIRS